MADEIVVDASVAAKCFITEPGSDLARRLVGANLILIAPELLFAELASVAAKRVKRGEISLAFGAQMVERAPELLDQFFPVGPYARQAFTLATAFGLSAYDGLYLALAQARNAKVITADKRFARKASDLGLGAFIVALDDYSPD